MANHKVTEVKIYFEDEVWQVEWHEAERLAGNEELEVETLSDAIEEVIWMLDLPCEAADFATSRDEGGYAWWIK